MFNSLRKISFGKCYIIFKLTLILSYSVVIARMFLGFLALFMHPGGRSDHSGKQTHDAALVLSHKCYSSKESPGTHTWKLFKGS